MPKNPPGLRQRHQAWEVRRRVPEDLRATFGKREVVRPLGTRVRDEALRRYFDVAKGIQAEFDKHRADVKGAPVVSGSAATRPVAALQLTPAQRRKACADYYARRVDEHRLKRHELLKRAKADPKAFFTEPRVDALAVSRLSFWEDAIKGDQISIEGAVFHFTAHEDAMRREALERAHLIGDCQEFFDATPDTLAYKDRVTLALDLMAIELKVLRALEIPPANLTTDEPAPTLPAATPAAAGPDFDTVLHKWLGQNAGKRWTPEHKRSCEGILLDFASVIGKRPVTAYTPVDGRDYKDLLTALPASWRKLKATRKLSLHDAVAYARKHKLPGQDPESVNKKLTIVGQFFRWAVNEYAELAILNPVHGFKVDKESGANDEWDPFTVEQLNAIFRTPPYTGAVSDTKWQHKGPNVLRESEKFWLPVLGLFTGARLNELCQLTRAHIREHEGVHYIALTKEMRLKKNPKMKLSPGIRNIPLHPCLIDVGFLEFVATRSGRLFPDLPMHSSGRYSDAPSKWFARLLKAFNIKTQKTSFHSLRHSFTTFASRHMDFDVRERLVGHVLPGQAGRYGQNFVAEQEDMELMLQRHAAMQRVKFTGLDLGHLALKLSQANLLSAAEA